MGKGNIPVRISNGRLIKQLKLWGFQEDRTRGDKIEMIGPDKKCVEVMREHVHQGNTTTRMKHIYKLVCDGDAELFWSRTERLTFATVYRNDAPRANPTKPLTQRIELPSLHPAPKPELRVADVPPEPLATTEATAKATRIRNRGLASQVLEIMTADPHQTVNSKLIAKVLGMADSEPVGAALAYLHDQGHVDRLMRGTYRLSPKLAASSTVHHAHTGPVDMVMGSSNGHVGPATVPATAREPEPVPVAPIAVADPPTAPTPEVTDVADLLLEFLIPDGYVFQVSHLRAIERWRDETNRLRAVLGGAS
jgi:hypothetical protein